MLKEHLLSRMQQILQIQPSMPASDLTKAQNPSIFLKSDRMYNHKIVRFNYTTYDVRRAQDVVNPGTSHHNIMLLSGRRTVGSDLLGSSTSASSEPKPHPYLYARVLGIYHANVIYTGPGMVDYTPRRMDFLWVRWYEHREGETPNRLDRLHFPPINSEGSFGFIDPVDVMRSCHIIPRFSKGRRHPGGIGFSRLAQDSQEWVEYNVGR